jgi:hypothetical protein
MTKRTISLPERGRLQKLFDVPERVGAVPLKLYKQLSPSNPESKIPFFMALHLLDKGQLAKKIVEEKPVKVRKNSTWFTCFALLEAYGLRKGVHYRELADFLGITPEAARAACLKAEFEIYAVYSLHVGFFTNDGTFRLATDKEVGLKYYQATMQMRGWLKRAAMYAHIASELGDRRGLLQAPLFSPPELTNGDVAA